MYAVHLMLTGKRVVDFLLVIIEHFLLGVTAEVLRLCTTWASWSVSETGTYRHVQD